MTLADALLQTIDIEGAITRRLLERVPEDRSEFAPHPRSMPLGKLAMHVATLPGLATVVLTTESFDVGKMASPDLVFRSPAALIDTFDAALASTRSQLESKTDEFLSTRWRFHYGERTLSDTPRVVTIQHMFLGHLSHHRAQLGTYLRALDIPVPGMYGPSADEKPS